MLNCSILARISDEAAKYVGTSFENPDDAEPEKNQKTNFVVLMVEQGAEIEKMTH